MRDATQTRTVGLLGGLSWESSALYYRLLNQAVQAAFGGHHNARSVLYTVDFAEMLALAEAERWNDVAQRLARAARRLEAAGAQCVVMASNTAHLVFAEVSAAVRVPVLHIGDALGKAARARAIGRIGLLGTRYVLDSQLYQQRLTRRHGVQVVLPRAAAREAVHRIIVDELTVGAAGADSRRQCLAVMDELAADGCQAVALACTELPLLLAQSDTAMPLLDTTRLHVDEAVSFALGVGDE